MLPYRGIEFEGSQFKREEKLVTKMHLMKSAKLLRKKHKNLLHESIRRFHHYQLSDKDCPGLFK